MGSSLSHKKFIFNDKFDRNFLFSMYEDDYPDIVEIFQSCLETFADETPTLRSAYHSGDLALLRKTVHKLKPVFGFAGLPGREAEAAAFELQLSQAASVAAIENEYHEFVNAVSASSDTIRAEIPRLISFIS